ncbi:MAG: SMI1/KNR4 family protein [Actinomycetota bacterium]
MRSEFISIIPKKLSRFGLYLYPIRCSKKEIERLEIYAQSPLPETYKEFMAFVGRGVGKYFEDINIFYPRVFENRNSMDELLEEEQATLNLAKQILFFHLIWASSLCISIFAKAMTRLFTITKKERNFLIKDMIASQNAY